MEVVKLLFETSAESTLADDDLSVLAKVLICIASLL